MYAHIGLLLILVLQLRNLNYVSPFVTCRKSYNFEKDTKCYVIWSRDKDQFNYDKIIYRVYWTECRERCDKDKKCTQFFHHFKTSRCYLSQCKNYETCNDTFSIYPYEYRCPWTRSIKGWWQFFYYDKKIKC